MKRVFGTFFICFILIFILFPITANADMGPKPSINITFENMGDEICYGTLLGEGGTGPYSPWDGDKAHIQNYSNLDLDIWEAFAYYQDSDGYYFLQEAWLCSDSKRLCWSYYPPDPFKILLYYPETDTFLVSGIYEGYAFDSYFSVNMEGIDISSDKVQEITLIAEKNYDYTGELISIVFRIVITVLLELGIAFIFGFRQKQLLVFIAGTNIVTQVILNVMLNVIRYKHGTGLIAFIVLYMPYEIVVFIAEIVLYCVFFNRISKTKIPIWKPAVYAIAANIISFVAGFWISMYIPMFF